MYGALIVLSLATRERMMRSVIRTSLIIAAIAAAASCGTEPGGLASVSQAVSAPAIRFAEIHYDNTGTDAGEAIEVSGPAGANVTGWQVILYNFTCSDSYATE